MTTPTDRAELERAIERLTTQRMAMPDELDLICAAARAYLATLPKTKMVEVWHVEFVRGDGEPFIQVCADKIIAEGRALHLHPAYTCIRVTGPHQHEMPAEAPKPS